MATKKRDDSNARSELRHYLKWKESILDYVSGQGRFVQPMTSTDSTKFTKLIRKFKYDPEFKDRLTMYSRVK